MIIYIRILKAYCSLRYRSYFNLFFRKNFLITRTACLSNDAIKLYNSKVAQVNIQKGRIDYLNASYNGAKFKQNFCDASLIIRKDLISIYFQQSLNFKRMLVGKHYFIMDSYSELTDQLFVHRKNTSFRFNANYTDVKDVAKLKYSCEGLLDLNSIKSEYNSFFNNLIEINPCIKIIYILFPIKFEQRKKFIDRNKIICDSIYDLKNIFLNLEIIDIPDEIVGKNPNDEFPYHYNNEVYSYVSNELKKHLI